MGFHLCGCLAQTGGVKTSTIVYVNQAIFPALIERLDNGRDPAVPLVPAKLEAYRALACSGSTPVSAPRGVLVVEDCVTHFSADVIRIDDQAPGEPNLTLEQNAPVELIDSDGYGLISPSLTQAVECGAWRRRAAQRLLHPQRLVQRDAVLL